MHETMANTPHDVVICNGISQTTIPTPVQLRIAPTLQSGTAVYCPTLGVATFAAFALGGRKGRISHRIPDFEVANDGALHARRTLSLTKVKHHRYGHPRHWNCRNPPPTGGFCPHQCANNFSSSRSLQTRRTTGPYARNRVVGPIFNGNDDDYDFDKNIVARSIDQIGQIISKPIPGIVPDFAIGYPIVLLLATAWLPITTSVILILFFSLFSYAGRLLIKVDELAADDGDETNTDLLALGGAIASAGLLSPIEGASDLSLAIPNALATSLLISTVGIGTLLWILNWNTDNEKIDIDESSSTSNLSPEQELMELWDKKMSNLGDDIDE